MGVEDSPGPGRVLIAETAGPLVAEPTWTRYDNITACRNYGFDSYAGRQSELDVCDTGNASVFFHDQDRTLDAADLVGCQIMLQLYDPYLAVWEPRWRGHIDDINRDLVNVPGAPLADTSLSCVGIFDYLGGVKFLPGIMGHPLPAGMVGVVFYEDGRVDERVIVLLDDANIDPEMRVTFTGNVYVNETLYDPDDVILQGCRDAADAEFPGIANFFEDRFGRAAFHGRMARFDPEGVGNQPGGWVFHRYYGATREDIASQGAAEIKSFTYNRPRARILNSYLAWPRADEDGFEFDRELIPSMVKTHAGSITQYGYRGDESPDLIIQKEYGASGGRTGKQLCELFSQFYVNNYHAIKKAVQQVTFQSCPPGDARAAMTWSLMTTGDISDAINLTIDEAGMANVPFFIDGVAIECRPLNPSYDLVTFTPNLTPQSYYGEDVFNP